MPLIQRKGAQSSQGFGEFAAASGVNPNAYIENLFSTWLYTGTGATQSIINNIGLVNTSSWYTNKLLDGTTAGYGITIDSSGNVYSIGSANSGVLPYIYITKYNSTGSLQWQRKLQDNSSDGYAITTDTSGNVYIAGRGNNGTNYYSLVAKYNSSGAIQWQRKLIQSNDARGTSIIVDSSNNVYVTGYANNGSNNYIIIVKYNSSGVIQWQRSLGQLASFGSSITTDSGGNVYVTGYTNSGGVSIIIAKYNSSGVIQWQRKLRQNSSIGNGIVTDTSNNVYISGYANDGTNNYMLIAKYDTNGTIQWQRKLQLVSAVGNGIAIDSNNNIYVVGNASDGTNTYSIVAKYNSSGVIQWQNQMIQNTPANGNGIATDASGNVYITGQSFDGTNTYSYISKLSQSGSATSGTAFLSLFAGASTDGAGTATDSAGTATDSASSATDSAGVATDSAGTATSTFASQSAVTSSGGLVWIKDRTNAYNHNLFDTAQGATKYLHSNTTDATATDTASLTSFNASGFSLGIGNTTGSQVNTNTDNFASWTFRKQAKFFDIVTYTGTGANRTIAHNLGSTPGCIIVKRTDTTSDWQVYHSGLTSAAYSIQLNLTAAQASAPTVWNSTAPTSSVFSVGTDATVNASGGTYVAYLFASNAGGFGSNGTQNVITCGSFTTDGSGNATVNLGYEPQWVLTKSTNVSGVPQWTIVDSLRGNATLNGTTNTEQILIPNSSGSESSSFGYANPTSTGFVGAGWGASINVIYIAIRRGPMATPTVGTSVFSPNANTSPASGAIPITPLNFNVDMDIFAARGGLSPNNFYVEDRLRVTSNNLSSPNLGSLLVTLSSSAETNSRYTNFYDTSFGIGNFGERTNLGASVSAIQWLFSRAPGFFDIVCYTGTGANTTQTHNLGVVPELMIVKERSAANNWQVYSATLANTQYLVLNTTAAVATGATRWNSTTPTSSVFSIGTDSTVNASAQTYVAYLFASCFGVSKVGSYTGTGATQTINCGFTGGARFVLIKRTDSTGDWYVWDTSRGMVSGTDPYLLLDSTAAEVNANNVYTTGVGFQIVGTGAGINASGGTYIFLAIA